VSRLALLGGRAVRRKPFPRYNAIGKEEKRAAARVLDSGVLSDFVGAAGEKFLGGREVRALEREWEAFFGVRHAVAMNSATSGLNAALGVLGLKPGDEVIVSSYTMSASATCAVVYGAVPVFADVEPDFFCLDPADVARKITRRTRAIVAVDLAGQPAALDPLLALARRHGLCLVEDAAQAPGSRYRDRWAGTAAPLGVFSLNAHKTIQTGEGGIVVTSDDALALKLRLIRNHAEAVVAGMPEAGEDLQRLYGWNYRMTELEAAIGREQLKKLKRLNRERADRVDYLNGKLRGILVPPEVRPGCTHVYYTHMLKIDPRALGISRDVFVRALRAEGVPAGAGYARPLYHLPLYRRRPAGGGTCAVAEKLFAEEVIVNTLIHPPLTRADLDDAARAYEKVAENAAALRKVRP